jgi:hypothetical protein
MAISASMAILLISPSYAEDFTLMVTNPDPLGLGAFVPSDADLDLGIEGKFKGDLSYGIGIYSVYNSNFFQTEDNEESELTTSLVPWLHYISDPEGGAMISVVANYSPSWNTYLENSDLNAFDQAGNITLSFSGGKSHLDVFAHYVEISGTDRLTGAFVQGTIMTAGLRATRQIASRTSLNAGWSYSISEYGSGDYEGAEVYTTYFGGLWQATPRISLGPTLRYTISESDNTGTCDAWALLFEARYHVGERLWLSASIGPEYTKNSNDTNNDSGLGLTGNLTARYVINERWTWTNSLRSATVPAPDETNYLVYNVAFNTALHRQLRSGSFGFGLQYDFSEYKDVGDVSSDVGNENYTSLFVNYQRPLYKDRVSFNTEVRYTFNEGQEDWSQWQVSAGLDVSF